MFYALSTIIFILITSKPTSPYSFFMFTNFMQIFVILTPCIDKIIKDNFLYDTLSIYQVMSCTIFVSIFYILIIFVNTFARIPFIYIYSSNDLT